MSRGESYYYENYESMINLSPEKLERERKKDENYMEKAREADRKNKKTYRQQILKRQSNLKMITPANAHVLALKYLPKPQFKKMLKSLVGELIIHKKIFTRLDRLAEKNKDYLKMYGITYQHFEDISNGNLTSFNILGNKDLLGITFKRNQGKKVLRYFDDKILANLIKTVFAYLPEVQDEVLSGLFIK